LSLMNSQTVALLTFGICASGFLLAQEYPHAFPREGARKLFENDRVAVWEVTWKNNVLQPIHRHLYDMAGVYLRYGLINVTTPDGRVSQSRPFDVPRPYFQLRGITHKEEGVGGPDDPERLAIMLDLKEPAASGAAAKSEMPPAFPRDGATVSIDNARVGMWDYTWMVNKPVPMHIHERDSVEVYVTGGTLLRRTADGKDETQTVATKDARFVQQGPIDSEEAVSGSPRAITIELK